MTKEFDVAVIGGGAAGFFAAAQTSDAGLRTVIFEKTRCVLQKVKISGGGRCNVTRAIPKPNVFAQGYPRGSVYLKKLFSTFGQKQTVQWFEKRGVSLKTEADLRMFPVTDDSQTVVDGLMRACYGVDLRLAHALTAIQPVEAGFYLYFRDKIDPVFAKTVIVCTGGSAKLEHYNFVKYLGLDVVPLVPSLFTFELTPHPFKHLAGVSVNLVAKVGQIQQSGAGLFTHAGLSGPAVLALSAFAARTLAEHQYQTTVKLRFAPADFTQDHFFDFVQRMRKQHPKRLITTDMPFELPRRLYQTLWQQAGIDPDNPPIWANLPAKSVGLLSEKLYQTTVQMTGKATFKEEFVTAGGIALTDLEANYPESKHYPGLYFAGEVLDIDGITGGYNFQAAWTTAYCAAHAAIERLR